MVKWDAKPRIYGMERNPGAGLRRNYPYKRPPDKSSFYLGAFPTTLHLPTATFYYRISFKMPASSRILNPKRIKMSRAALSNMSQKLPERLNKRSRSQDAEPSYHSEISDDTRFDVPTHVLRSTDVITSSDVSPEAGSVTPVVEYEEEAHEISEWEDIYDEFGYCANIEAVVDGIPLESFRREQVPQISTLPPMGPPVDQGASTFNTQFNPSEDVSRPRIHSEVLSAFVLAIGLWCIEAGISRKLYEGLRQILKLLEPHPLLKDLPQTFQPLQRRVYGHIPQIPLRKALIPLNSDKLATMAESRKEEARRLGNQVPKEFLYFFDAPSLFKRFLQSDLRQQLHFGFGHFVDTPSEPWHSLAWMSSVRTTSGMYARYSDGEPIFPSDTVSYRPSDTSCQHTQIHVGRVVAVGLDFRKTATALDCGALRVLVQNILFREEIDPLTILNEKIEEHEILLTSSYEYLPESSIISPSPITIYFDYLSGDKRLEGHTSQSQLGDSRHTCKKVRLADGGYRKLCFTPPYAQNWN